SSGKPQRSWLPRPRRRRTQPRALRYAITVRVFCGFISIEWDWLAKQGWGVLLRNSSHDDQRNVHVVSAWYARRPCGAVTSPPLLPPARVNPRGSVDAGVAWVYGGEIQSQCHGVSGICGAAGETPAAVWSPC